MTLPRRSSSLIRGRWAERLGRQIVAPNDRIVLRSSYDDAELVLQTVEEFRKFKGGVGINGGGDKRLEEFSGGSVALLQLAATAGIRPWRQKAGPPPEFDQGTYRVLTHFRECRVDKSSGQRVNRLLVSRRRRSGNL